MFHVRGPGTNFLFTGDMNLQESNLTRGAAIPKHPVETLFIEGTYGNRHQPPREQVVQLMNEKIDEAISNKGKVIIPAFAFGRSQDLLMELVRGHQIYFDGLSNRILGCFLEQGREIIPRFEHLEQAAKRCVRVTTPKLRLRAMNEAQIIITTGGMLDGGPVISYLKQLWNDPRSKIFLSGYQGEGTNGERLEQHRQLILDGKLCQVACEVVDTKQSAHSDLGSLLTFVEKVQPRNLVIMHSEESEAFRQHLLDRFPTLNVIVPTIGTSYTLDGS